MASAGEAELASAFGNAKIGHDERTILYYILRNLGLAHDAITITLKKKPSKSMDLRWDWDWLRDRVAQNIKHVYPNPTLPLP